MSHIAIADIELKIIWHSEQAKHTERKFFQGISLQQDFLPDFPNDKLIQAPNDTWLSKTYDMATSLNISARSSIVVDPTHPLAQRTLDISLRIIERHHTDNHIHDNHIHDNHNNEIIRTFLLAGLGLQAPLSKSENYYAADSFDKIDKTDDAVLYQNANLEDTFDRHSAVLLSELYGRHIKSGHRVLDIMCGAQSYLPATLTNAHVTGIGLNAEELAANKQLTDWSIHNVNATPSLPFEDNAFDAVVFTAAVEYLTDPLAIFAKLKRIVKSGGTIIVTFTDHWTSSKSIKLWSTLLPFERLGLLLDYFMQTDGFSSLQTETIQGLARLDNDIFAKAKRYADPIFSVNGCVA